VKNLKELLAAYASLSKVKLGYLVVVSTMVGFYLAPGPFAWGPFLWSSVGTSLAIASAHTINQWIEIDKDEMMKRTLNRILPTKKISPTHALIFGISTGFMGVTMLYTEVNTLSALLALVNILLYTAVYTPLKQIHWLNSWVGAIVGAIPPLIGWAACTGTLSPGAWVLGTLLYIWQIPHFLSLSWNLRHDYEKAGFKMLSVSNPARLPGTTLAWTMMLFPMGALASFTNTTTWIFAFDSIILSLPLAYLAIKFNRDKSSATAKRLFMMTIYWLTAFMALMMYHKKGDKEKEVPSITAQSTEEVKEVKVS